MPSIWVEDQLRSDVEAIMELRQKLEIVSLNTYKTTYIYNPFNSVLAY